MAAHTLRLLRQSVRGVVVLELVPSPQGCVWFAAAPAGAAGGRPRSGDSWNSLCPCIHAPHGSGGEVQCCGGGLARSAYRGASADEACLPVPQRGAQRLPWSCGYACRCAGVRYHAHPCITMQHVWRRCESPFVLCRQNSWTRLGASRKRSRGTSGCFRAAAVYPQPGPQALRAHQRRRRRPAQWQALRREVARQRWRTGRPPQRWRSCRA